MFLILAGVMMPVLLVFGLYHLLTWFNVGNINGKVFWKRVGLTSAISHLILASGFFVFSYVDYNANQATTLAGVAFDNYLFNGSQFWELMLFFDTVPMLVLLAAFTALDRAGMNPSNLVAVSIAVTLIVGTIQWYYMGGGIGLLLERFWTGLKSGEETDEDWF
jgi:hypothetical protein